MRAGEEQVSRQGGQRGDCRTPEQALAANRHGGRRGLCPARTNPSQLPHQVARALPSILRVFRETHAHQAIKAAGASFRIVIGGASRSRIAAIRLACVLLSKALLPVSISYSTQPKAQMSVRASASLPSSCSGAMYWKVPRIGRERCRHRRRGSQIRRGVGQTPRVRLAGLKGPCYGGGLRQPEIEQLGPSLRDHDVAGLEVPMDDTLAVRLIEAVGDLDAIPHRLVERQPGA